ncbi:MAG: penicillin-binding protein activator [Ignavibacteriales bacterium]|nr:penicillin-binding protein activator [Ignavibacteriales bacterium]
MPAVDDSVAFRQEVEQMFRDATAQFKSGKYDRAADLFSTIVNQYPESHRVTGAYIMAAKAYYHTGDYKISTTLLKNLLARYPRSAYADDAHYTLGLTYYHANHYYEAAAEFLDVRQESSDSKLTQRAEELLTVIASSQLSLPQLKQLLNEAKVSPLKMMLSVHLAEKIWNTGDVNGAQTLLRPIAALKNGTPVVLEAVALLRRIEQSGVVKVGVVLPLMQKTEQSAVEGLGNELLDGMRFAVDDYNKEAMPKVNLEIRDSERDAGVATRQVSELTQDDQIVAIVGPVFSHEVFASAPIANKRGTPLMTPTATSDGLAGVGEYIFQANPDFSTRARAMAQYAYQTLGARTFAVLSPTDTAGKIMAQAFQDEVKKLGGEMIDVQWYEPGQTDLHSQFVPMRIKALQMAEPIVINFGPKLMKAPELKKMAIWGVPQSLLDSLTATNSSVSVEFLFGGQGRLIADSLKIPTQRIRAKYDSLGFPVTNIDAMFFPIAGSEEISTVASQLRYFNFQTQMLGTGNWNDLSELEQNRTYTNGIIFSSDAYWEATDQLYQNFASRFETAYNKKPTRNTLFGYDAMKLLLKVIKQGATRRAEIASALSTVRNFIGVHSKISFGNSRVNSFLTLMQFKSRALKKIAEIDVERKDITTIGQ